MNKQKIALLEKAYVNEIEAATTNGILPIQPRGKLPLQMVEEGLLESRTVRLGGRFPVTIGGYVLTHLGRYIYCQQCPPIDESAVQA